MDMDMTLDDYRKLVEQVMRETMSAGNEATPRVFSNIGIDHAGIVVGTMLSYAQSEVCVYTDKLSSEVWDPAKVCGYLARVPSATLKVIVDCPDACAHQGSALAVLTDEIRTGRVVVRHAKARKLSAHMCVADRRHIRLEQDATTRKALVSFGDSELGAAAIDAFEQCWKLNA